jgi:hypothetical protein
MAAECSFLTPRPGARNDDNPKSAANAALKHRTT